MDLHTLDAGVHLVTTVVAGGIFASQVDDLQVDAQYFVRGLHRRSRASDSIALREALRTVPQKRIAILVPAWKEAGVIQQMLEHNVAALDYDGDKYDFFCGTYPNDLETQRKVDAAARVASNVHKIVLPHDGPTSKADCLNWVYQGVVLLEHRRGERFDILLMHDAEDLIHPLSLRLYSSLIPRYEFVQTPVFSLPNRARENRGGDVHRRIRRAPPEGHARTRGHRGAGAFRGGRERVRSRRVRGGRHGAPAASLQHREPHGGLRESA